MNWNHGWKRIKGLGRPMLLALIVALVASMALPPAAGAVDAGGPAIYLSPASQSLATGKTTTVNLMIKNVSNLYGAEVHLGFDKTLLEVQDADATKDGIQIAPSSALFPFEAGQYATDEDSGKKYYYKYAETTGGYFYVQAEASNALGVVDYTVVLLNPAAAVSAGADGKILATITFKCIGEGQASINVDSVKLVDANADPITGATTSGATITQGAFPVVVSTSPVKDDASVSIGTNISITFNKAMNKTLTEGAFSITPSVAGTFSWTDSDKTLTLDPTATLVYSTTYTVKVTTAAKDANGIALDGNADGTLQGSPTDDYSWSFTTGADVTAPTVSTISPAANATAVPIDAVAQVTFSEAMHKSLTEGAFSISPSVSGAFTWSNNTLIFDPTDDLAYGTLYTVTVAVAAKDLAGNPLAAGYTSKFTTAAPPFAARVLPKAVSRGETFQVSVNFTAPEDNFNSIGLTDFAPEGWMVVSPVDKTLSDPDANQAPATGNKVEMAWILDTYPEGTAFTAVYKVTVPSDAALGPHTFGAGSVFYFIAGDEQPAQPIGGHSTVVVASSNLVTDPVSLDYDFGEVPKGQTKDWSFEISNSGPYAAGTLEWTVSEDLAWLTVTPTSGTTTTTETDSVTVQIDTSALMISNAYQGDITISSNGGNKSGTIKVSVILEVLRDLPAKVGKGTTFEVSVSFIAPEDNFNSIGLTDYAPEGWTVVSPIDKTLSDPDADQAPATGNKAEIAWILGTYTKGTAFKAVYKVTVPSDAADGFYFFGAGSLLFFVGSGELSAKVTGDTQVEVIPGSPVVGKTYEVKGTILAGVTVALIKGGVEKASAVSDAQGNYTVVAPETGSYTVRASKTGFRTYNRTLAVTEVGKEYTVNFTTVDALVPNAPTMAYALGVVNKWLATANKWSGWEAWPMTMAKALAVVNAWLFPIK